ncbi:DDE-type integrase/transposase/recombinase [Pseudomonas congelans]|uniref:helix-turn-helix domain-containing protein n=1 Tax=Pseudomonas congelans TaxID=200452 RepID=UPI001F45D66B|nr:helix-turn-helix domain-containing protein [Pseudomonas congelans]MCF5162940.1 DDE-type integrase/transposase/recombinase [Pseudomonas congelans]
MKSIRPGSLAYWRNQACVILELKGLLEAVVRMTEDQSTNIVRATELRASPVSDSALTAKHIFAEDRDWTEAVERHKLIQPLLANGRKSMEEVQAAAASSGRSVSTIYRWIKRFEETGLVSSLLRTVRQDKGQLRLDQELEEIIEKWMQKTYLALERPTVKKLHQDIKTECEELGLQPPHVNTIHQRVRDIDERERHKRRMGPRSAKDKYRPLRGAFPATDVPNSVVQIDHTPVDVIIVDEADRLPIGRPNLTMSIDVHTRMIGGFFFSLDPVGANSAALCIAHAVMQKNYWLAARDIPAEWPIYGLMQKIHVDNAKEFKGHALTRGCNEYGIILEHRPRKQPNYGPHIERAFRTFMAKGHELPGTTFSNTLDKLDYDSEGKACMTLKELELWFTIFVVYIYHNDAHTGLNGVSPINYYSQCVHGTKDRPGVGLPEPIENEEKFRLDFTPYFQRTVQRHGAKIDGIHYYAPILRTRIAEEGDDGKGRKFIFVQDPRDISVVYFLDPDEEIYHPVPYFNSSHPAISVWELREVTRRIRETPGVRVDEAAIFEGVRRMRVVENDAIEKTRLARNARASEKRKRRMAERRHGWKGVHVTLEPPVAVESAAAIPDVVEAYDEIEVG